MPTNTSLQSDFVIGVLSGVLTLSSITLAIFGFVFSAFTQVMSRVGADKPPRVAYDLKQVAIFTLILNVVSDLIAGMCVRWLYVPTEHLLSSIWMFLGFLLLCLCGILFYIVVWMMKLQ